MEANFEERAFSRARSYAPVGSFQSIISGKIDLYLAMVAATMMAVKDRLAHAEVIIPALTETNDPRKRGTVILDFLRSGKKGIQYAPGVERLFDRQVRASATSELPELTDEEVDAVTHGILDELFETDPVKIAALL